MKPMSKNKNNIDIEEANDKLKKAYSPGLVVFADEDAATALYLHVRILNSGWVHTLSFDDVSIDYAPGTVVCVERAETLSKLKSDSGEREFDPEWFEYILSGGVEVA